ncbi:MAG: DUF4093 domain-containing protein [Firmicutes bacterium]|nr:DUF4093 domain-containing protein [Bacillota bacterium]
MADNLPKIEEVIVVEGRDDTAAIKRAVRAVTIETHGFGISKNTWDKIDCAYKTYGIIVFTDPDHAGEEIRRKILASYPDAKQAFLTKEKASEKKRIAPNEYAQEDAGEKNIRKARPDIGIENASPEDIREALEKAKASIKTKVDLSAAGDSPSHSTSDSPSHENDTLFETFSMKDLDEAGLSGGEGAKERREKIGDILGIGYSNAKGLLYKLNTLGIERKSFEEAVKKI